MKSPRLRPLTVILSVLLLFQVIQPINASERLSEAKVIRAIIGEASNQPYLGQVAVAEAIRNRGHLRGVYGLKARHVDSEPLWVWRMARRAWHESKTSNLTNGAKFWHNVDREGHNYWTVTMIETAKIGQHNFFKEK